MTQYITMSFCCKRDILQASAGQVEGSKRDPVRRVVTIFAVYYAETAAVIPHVQANAVALERCSHVVQPAGAVLRVGVLAVNAKFVAGERNVPMLRPLGGLADFNPYAGCVPVIEPVPEHG